MQILKKKLDLDRDVLSKRKAFFDLICERPESFSKQLPFDEYVAEFGMYKNKDGSLGVVFEADLIEHEVLTSNAIVDTVNSLKGLLNLPENCVLQVLYDQYGVSQFDSRFKTYKEQFQGGHPVAEKIFNGRLEQIQKDCGTDSPYRPLARSLLVTVRYYSNEKKTPAVVDMVTRADGSLSFEAKEEIRKIKAFEHILAQIENSSKLTLKRMPVEKFIDYLRRQMNPKTYYKRSFASYSDESSISEQILFNGPSADPSGVSREGKRTRTITLVTKPKHAYPGGMAYFTTLPYPFRLSLNFSFPLKEKVKRFLDLKEFFLENTPSAKARRQRADVLKVQDKLAHDDRAVALTCTVIVEGETEDELDRYCREVSHLFNNELDCEVIVEEDIGYGLWFNSLPLCYSPESDFSSQRALKILRSDAVKFLPVFDSFRGTKKPVQIFTSREKNLIPFSLIENETSNHTVVLGDTGSGKSAFILNWLEAAKRLAPEPLVFVIDKRSSYHMFSKFFEGDLTAFSADEELSFSHFRGTFDEAKVSFLTRMIASAVRLTSPNYELESEQLEAITKALKLAYLKKCGSQGLSYEEGELMVRNGSGSVEICMEDFIVELAALSSERGYEDMAIKIAELLNKLRPFYGDGTYAKYFAPSAVPERKKAYSYFYDLDGLDSDPVLKALMSMGVMEEISQMIRRQENRERGGIIIIEEIGVFGRDNPYISNMILDFAETVRKLGFYLISLTPRPQNYFELDAGRAMWSVADNFVFLQMSDDNVTYLQKNSNILDEATSQIVKSLRTYRGKHAEVFYTNKKKSIQGAFEYRQTPIERWLAPTNSKDGVAAEKALERFAGEKWKALDYLCERYPDGSA